MASPPKRFTGTPDSKARRRRVLSGSIHAVEDKRKFIVVRMNAEERAAVKWEAEHAGLEIASWIRLAIRAQLSTYAIAQGKRAVHQPAAPTSTDADVTSL